MAINAKVKFNVRNISMLSFKYFAQQRQSYCCQLSPILSVMLFTIIGPILPVQTIGRVGLLVEAKLEIRKQQNFSCDQARNSKLIINYHLNHCPLSPDLTPIDVQHHLLIYKKRYLLYNTKFAKEKSAITSISVSVSTIIEINQIFDKFLSTNFFYFIFQ